MASYLDHAGLADPDSMIRTGGQMRLSNFMLWQLTSTEWWVTETSWRDSTERVVYQTVADDQNRHRRLGRVA